MTTATPGSEPAGDPHLPSDHATLYADHANLLAAVDQLGVTMCLLDEHGRVLWVNDAWRRFALQNGGDPARCCQGSDYLAQLHNLQAAGGRPDLAVALRSLLAGTGEAAAFDYACDTPAGRRWFQARFRAFGCRDRRRVLVVHEDITARKLTEEARTESTQLLMRLRSMATLGAFTQGVVHDFNNLLTVMIGNTELARLHAGANAELQDLLATVTNACQQARLLTQQLLQRGREHGGLRAHVDLARVVRDVASLLRAAIPATLRLELHLGDVPAVVADASQIHQLVMNLATNARQAMRDDGTLTMTLAATDDRPSTLARDERRWLRLQVADTGPGIDAAVLPRIFEPFFTTKTAEQGTGLGLSIVQEIARGHGGTVEVASQRGAGATFTVWLPVLTTTTTATRHATTAMPAHDGIAQA